LKNIGSKVAEESGHFGGSGR